MVTSLLTSAGQDMLVTAFGTTGVKSATNIASGRDTPIPTVNFSYLTGLQQL